MTRRQHRLLRLALMSLLVLVGLAWWSIERSTEPVRAPEEFILQEPPRHYRVEKAPKRQPESFAIRVDRGYGPCGERAKFNLEPTEPSPELVRAARKYFDLNEELVVGHKAFRDALQHAAKRQGLHVLAHPPTLRRLIARARSFGPPLDEGAGPRRQGPRIDHVAGTDYGDEFARDGAPWGHLSVPRILRHRRRRFTRRRLSGNMLPWPTLLVLHSEEDTYPSLDRGVGERCLQRIWPKDVARHILDHWFVLIPIVETGSYAPNGVLRRRIVFDPLRRLWNHDNVDVDRIVVDGGADVLTLLGSSASFFFAGAVLRGGALDTPKLQASVLNYAHVPLHVVGDAPLAEALKQAGHPHVTFEPEVTNQGLGAWLGRRRRCQPRSFLWTVFAQDQTFAWWINVDKADWSEGASRSLFVRCIDTPSNPNTVVVHCEGIDELSFFLSDEVVDLDRKVRIVINGRVMFDEATVVPDHMAPLTRNMNTLFLHPTLGVRDSRYYGQFIGLIAPRLKVLDLPAEPVGALALEDEREATGN